MASGTVARPRGAMGRGAHRAAATGATGDSHPCRCGTARYRGAAGAIAAAAAASAPAVTLRRAAVAPPRAAAPPPRPADPPPLARDPTRRDLPVRAHPGRAPPLAVRAVGAVASAPLAAADPDHRRHRNPVQGRHSRDLPLKNTVTPFLPLPRGNLCRLRAVIPQLCSE